MAITDFSIKIAETEVTNGKCQSQIWEFFLQSLNKIFPDFMFLLYEIKKKVMLIL